MVPGWAAGFTAAPTRARITRPPSPKTDWGRVGPGDKLSSVYPVLPSPRVVLGEGLGMGAPLRRAKPSDLLQTAVAVCPLSHICSWERVVVRSTRGEGRGRVRSRGPGPRQPSLPHALRVAGPVLRRACGVRRCAQRWPGGGRAVDLAVVAAALRVRVGGAGAGVVLRFAGDRHETSGCWRASSPARGPQGARTMPAMAQQVHPVHIPRRRNPRVDRWLWVVYILCVDMAESFSV